MSQPLRAVHVAWIGAAMLGVILVVDGVAVARAYATHPGEVTERSYLQGLDFNSELARRDKQRRLGWTAEAGLSDGRLVVRLHDAGGAAVTGAFVTATVRLAGIPGEDQVLVLDPSAPGDYSTKFVPPHRRRVEVRVLARQDRGGEVVFEAGKSLFVR